MKHLIGILVGFLTVWLMFPRRKHRHTEPNPTYSKPFWRQVREDTDPDHFEYPGSPPGGP